MGRGASPVRDFDDVERFSLENAFEGFYSIDIQVALGALSKIIASEETSTEEIATALFRHRKVLREILDSKELNAMKLKVLRRFMEEAILRTKESRHTGLPGFITRLQIESRGESGVTTLIAFSNHGSIHIRVAPDSKRILCDPTHDLSGDISPSWRGIFQRSGTRCRECLAEALKSKTTQAFPASSIKAATETRESIVPPEEAEEIISSTLLALDEVLSLDSMESAKRLQSVLENEAHLALYDATADSVFKKLDELTPEERFEQLFYSSSHATPLQQIPEIDIIKEHLREVGAVEKNPWVTKEDFLSGFRNAAYRTKPALIDWFMSNNLPITEVSFLAHTIALLYPQEVAALDAKLRDGKTDGLTYNTQKICAVWTNHFQHLL
jgi:hypothetical protein